MLLTNPMHSTAPLKLNVTLGQLEGHSDRLSLCLWTQVDHAVEVHLALAE